MEAASESIEPPVAPPLLPGGERVSSPADARIARGRRLAERTPRLTERTRGLPIWVERLRFAIAVYLGTRVLLVAVALLDRELRHQRLISELANWDGMWFRELARNGYPTQVSHAQTVLGFFPLYPLSMWAVAHTVGAPSIVGVTVAGVILSGAGGVVTTVLVQELTTGWWGRESGRRATLLFCLFPGSVVFSMVYAEGLLLPLAAGCILALQKRRWLLAGILAGVATATQPDALAIIPVCAASAFVHLRDHGWRNRAARRSLLAPCLSLTGVSAVAAFLWVWTGTPFAIYEAQHFGWGEKTDPLALLHQAETLIGQISFTHFNHPTINLNLIVGLLGAVVLAVGVAWLLQRPRKVSIEGMVWTLSIGFLAVTSEYVPPNPRLLITAFPAVLVLAHRLRGRAATYLFVVNGLLLAGMSYLTFVATALRP
jgi:hypothetical protein